MSGTYLFLGPSLDAATARAAAASAGLDVTVLPPVGRGDLDALLAGDRPPAAVGIVDGRFMHTLAVSPKEVMRALAAGVTVYGSSSMGALRAAECHRYGMVGVGRVFEMFRDGLVDADDEVGISFDPESLRATSEPMVNIRVAMELALAEDLLDVRTVQVVLREAKNLYFPDRTYANVGALMRHAHLLDAGQLARYDSFVGGARVPDQKRSDALALVERMRSDALVAASA